MQQALVPSVVANARFNYFDIVLVVWLIIGLLWGFKRGMTLELVPLSQWMGSVFAGGLLYRAFPARTFTTAPITLSFGPISRLICWSFFPPSDLHSASKETLTQICVGKIVWARRVLRLGMMAGGVRFGCVLLVGFALMNARLASSEEMAKAEKSHQHDLSRALFLHFGAFQQNVVFNSMSGHWVQSNLPSFLIASAPPRPSPQGATLADNGHKL